MRTFFLFLLFSVLASYAPAQTKTFHEYTVKDIDGNPYPLSKLKGKKVLVVNVASKCGLTPQYEQLQSLYETYGGEDFIIIGFPANNFREQEPGTAEEIKEFCRLTYGVTFPLMEKISVQGDDMAPVYAWLTQKEFNGVQDAPVTWNFQKFMIDEEGRWAGVAEPASKPDSEEILPWIEGK